MFYRKSGDLDGHYTMDHSAGTYLFDPAGRLRLYVRHGEAPDNLVADRPKQPADLPVPAFPLTRSRDAIPGRNS